MKFIGVVLAGGNSSRMGCDKAQLIRASETMLEFTTSLLVAVGAHKVIVSVRQGSESGTPDKFSNSGPLAGLEAVMSLQSIGTWCLFCPIDLPHLTPNALLGLLEQTNSEQSAIYYQDHPLPLLIQVTADNLNLLTGLLKQKDNLSIKHYLALIKASALMKTPVQELINTNTPAQWQQAIKKIN